ncbi:AMP-binding protein [bacterium]|nr:AMP-binding protein [bacterium]
MKLATDYFRNIQQTFTDGFVLSDVEFEFKGEQLDQLIDQVLTLIRARQEPRRQVSVAICLDRSVYYIAAMFAAWKAGGYFIPLNTKWPIDKMNDVLDHCQADIVIVEDSLGEIHGKNRINLTDIKTCKSKKQEWAVNLPSDLAYVIYTSGSTGNPKGVMITHAAYASYVEWTKNYFRAYSENKKLILTSELTFDITMGDIAFALSFGTEVHISENPQNIIGIYKMIAERRIDTLYSVPTTHTALFSFVDKKRGASLSCIKLVLSGGDSFSLKLIKLIKKLAPKSHFHNVYGPTEMTINCFTSRMDNQIETIEAKGRIPIGRAFDIIDFAIIDDKGIDVTNTGGKGVLCVTGPQTMLGYFNDRETTKHAFVNDVRYPEFKRQLYSTGDVAMLDADGQVYLFGRSDHLVKIKGYRIHPDEITMVALEKTEVLEAATIVHHAPDGDRLSLYVVQREKFDLDELRNLLAEKLPDYMVPRYIRCIAAMPLNNSGKVDKIALQELEKNE